MPPAQQANAGKLVIGLLASELFAKGYDANVVVSVAKLAAAPYLRAASAAVKGRPFESKVFFSFDQEGNAAARVLTALRDLPSRARAYGTGVTACWRGNFHDAIATGRRNRQSGAASLVYIWTLDRAHSMRRYIDSGAEAILTNYPARLLQVIRDRGGVLATRKTVLPLATSDTISASP
jgi:glycerophosphoryl diester phosphodiesterase